MSQQAVFESPELQKALTELLTNLSLEPIVKHLRYLEQWCFNGQTDRQEEKAARS